MIIIYDSTKPVEQRCLAYPKAGDEPIVCGCFDIKVESTVNGEAREQLHAHRWGNAKLRKETHKMIGEKVEGK